MVLRALAKLLTKQAKAMDFLALVVQFIHACCPENSHRKYKLLIISSLQICYFHALFECFCGIRPDSYRKFG